MNSSSPGSRHILNDAMRVLHYAESSHVNGSGARVVHEIGELLTTRAELMERLRCAQQSDDVIANRLLADQLEKCVAEIDAKLHDSTQLALQFLRRSA